MRNHSPSIFFPIPFLYTSHTHRLRENYRQQKTAKVKVELMYKEYRNEFCFTRLLEPKNRAEFGKLVKLAFPFIRKRRLGPAGAQVSYYCGLGPKPRLSISASTSTSISHQLDKTTCTTHQTVTIDIDRKSFSRMDAADLRWLEETVKIPPSFPSSWDMNYFPDIPVGAGTEEAPKGSVSCGVIDTPYTYSTGNPYITAPKGGFGREDWMDSLPSYSFFFSSLLSKQ